MLSLASYSNAGKSSSGATKKKSFYFRRICIFFFFFCFALLWLGRRRVARVDGIGRIAAWSLHALAVSCVNNAHPETAASSSIIHTTESDPEGCIPSERRLSWSGTWCPCCCPGWREQQRRLRRQQGVQRKQKAFLGGRIGGCGEEFLDCFKRIGIDCEKENEVLKKWQEKKGSKRPCVGRQGKLYRRPVYRKENAGTEIQRSARVATAPPQNPSASHKHGAVSLSLLIHCG